MNQEALSEMSLDQVVQAALRCQRAGDLKTAIAIYREVVQAYPQEPEYIFMLAVCEHQMGQLEAADMLFRALVKRRPREPRYHLGLARNLKENGKPAEAVQSYRTALRLAPASLDAMLGLGSALWRSGEIDEAVATLSRAQTLHPTSLEIVANLGNALFQGGRVEEALGAYRQVLAMKPDLADGHNNLGRALLHLGNIKEAQAAFEETLRLSPRHAEAHFNLANLFVQLGELDSAAEHFSSALEGNVAFADGYAAFAKLLYDAGHFDDALYHLERYLKLRPEDPKGHIWSGLVHRDRAQYDEAFEFFRRACELDPDSGEGYALIGSTHWMLGQHPEAAEAAKKAYARDPNFPPVSNLLGNLALLSGKLEEALGWYKNAVTLDPVNEMPSYDNLLFVSNYSDQYDASALLDVHRTWGQHMAKLVPAKAAKRPINTSGRLNIGFLSPDFNQHSVAYFFEPLLQHLDRDRFQPFCYYSNRRIDTTTKRLSEYVEWWRPIAGLGDDAVVRQIEEDKIDILVDLAGHTSDNRLAVFARQPAPLQMTYLGYPTTTGMTEIQYRITDWLVDPAGDEHLSSEQLLRLPHSYFCYRPPESSPAVEASPVISRGHITFGSFNNMAKASPSSFRLWANVLKAVPGSCLRLKSLALANGLVRDKVMSAFRDESIDIGRVMLLPWQSDTASHLATYHDIDIGLDTTPYNGATTTCEALWMGVPVISLRGGTHSSRMGASILSAAGMADLVANTEEEFVRRCVELASDVNVLAARRLACRPRLMDSPLMNQTSFTRHFEAALESAIRSLA